MLKNEAVAFDLKHCKNLRTKEKVEKSVIFTNNQLKEEAKWTAETSGVFNTRL